jgi:hypothetical protein
MMQRLCQNSEIRSNCQWYSALDDTYGLNESSVAKGVADIQVILTAQPVQNGSYIDRLSQGGASTVSAPGRTVTFMRAVPS